MGSRASGEVVESWVDRDGADLASKLVWNRLGQISRKYPTLEISLIPTGYVLQAIHYRRLLVARGRVQLPTFALGVVTPGVCTASHKIAYDEKSPISIGVWSTLQSAVRRTRSQG